jgi:hypothetical protein
VVIIYRVVILIPTHDGYGRFTPTFNNISVISWRSVLLVEETGVPRENNLPATSHWQTLSHNVVSSTPWTIWYWYIWHFSMRWWCCPFCTRHNTLNWIFIALAHWYNSPKVYMSLHKCCMLSRETGNYNFMIFGLHNVVSSTPWTIWYWYIWHAQ